MVKLFGWEFKREQQSLDPVVSFSKKEHEDGAVEISAGGSYGTYVDLDGSVRTEAELVTKYRDMIQHPECDAAVDEIINESISFDEKDIVEINLDNINISENIKKKIRDEFGHCINLLDFNRSGYEIYKRWYVDGRLYYHVMIDEKSPQKGVLEVRYIDPRKIRKVREVIKRKVPGGEDIETSLINRAVNEYFIFNDRGFNAAGANNPNSINSTAGLKIAKDSIIHVTSGITDVNGTMVLSHLHKSMKALNQLRTLEDALVIYRLARAPERRVWYIGTGNLPKAKAEEYVRSVMVSHKNRLVYDADTGNVRDDRKFMTMLEDYWIPRRDGDNSTQVTTLAGGQNLSQMDDVLYFQKKFLQTLNVPVSRLNSDALFSVGRATEITRDEVKFNKFVTRLRAKFAGLFVQLLEKQCVLKGIVSIEDWEKFKSDIRFDFAKDNFFTELKDGEILQTRIGIARDIQDMAGKYYSNEWIRKNVLQQSDDDIEEMDAQIKKEENSGDPRWVNPMLAQQPPETTADDQTNPNDMDATESNDPEVAPNPDENRLQQLAAMPNRSLQDEAEYKALQQKLSK